MIRLVSLERAKFWLNVIHDHDDLKLDLAIVAASQAVIDYLDMDTTALVDSDDNQLFEDDGSPTGVNEVEQVATAILVGKLYDGMDVSQMQYGRLPMEVTSMLYIRRREMGLA